MTALLTGCLTRGQSPSHQTVPSQPQPARKPVRVLQAVSRRTVPRWPERASSLLETSPTSSHGASARMSIRSCRLGTRGGVNACPACGRLNPRRGPQESAMGSANQYQADDDNASTGELHQLVLCVTVGWPLPRWCAHGEVVRAGLWSKHPARLMASPGTPHCTRSLSPASPPITARWCGLRGRSITVRHHSTRAPCLRVC